MNIIKIQDFYSTLKYHDSNQNPAVKWLSIGC